MLRSKKAQEVTFQIIETFSQLREISKNINKLTKIKNKEGQNQLLNESGKLFSELFENSLNSNNKETTLEINFAVLKFKHTIRK